MKKCYFIFEYILEFSQKLLSKQYMRFFYYAYSPPAAVVL